MRESLKFTPTVYNDVYPSIDPTKKELNLVGKVVIVTGLVEVLVPQGLLQRSRKLASEDLSY